jgi:hypothetical protein
VRRDEINELLDQLHEVLDERFEAGPAPYVIDTMTAESADGDEWAAEVVYEPSPGASRQGLRLLTLGGRTPVDAAWEIYRRLEAGTSVDGEPDERGVIWATL